MNSKNVFPLPESLAGGASERRQSFVYQKILLRRCGKKISKNDWLYGKSNGPKDDEVKKKTEVIFIRKGGKHMKKEDLYHAISEIRPEYLEESDSYRTQKPLR